MKKIEAIIRRTKFEDVKEALLVADIEWFSYYEVRGVGKARQGRIYRGVVYDTSSIERILISIVVREKNLEKTINAIQKADAHRNGTNVQHLLLNHIIGFRYFHYINHGKNPFLYTA